MEKKSDRGMIRSGYFALSILACIQLLFGWPILFAQQPEPGAATSTLPYLDFKLPLEARVNDLLSRLTVEEKISLLGETAPAMALLHG